MSSPLWTGAQAREIDHLSIDRFGIEGDSLMEEAGRSVFQKILLLRKPYQNIVLLAGPGNNGGDALVAARLLIEAGFQPLVFSVMEASARESEARARQRLRCEALGLSLIKYRSSEDFRLWGSASILVDGLLGLGVKSPLRPGLILQALEDAAARQPATVLAIDLPSGLDPDRWEQNAPLPATHTITFGAFKPVHIFSARSNCGELSCVRLGFHPDAISATLERGPHLSGLEASSELPWARLSADAHKYSRGHVLIIGGSPGKLGAPLLSARAALRAGAGWVSCAPLSLTLSPSLPNSFTYESWALDQNLSWDKLGPFLKERRVKALLIGPGAMQNPLSPELLAQLAEYAAAENIFIVFDAGALRAWRKHAEGLRFDPKRTLLTPHPGEWLAIDKQHRDLHAIDGLEEAWSFCEQMGVSLCYKSARPLTLSFYDGRRELRVNTRGDQRLGKAGSGDILAGVALTLGASGLSAPDAAHMAQDLVGLAARSASERFGFHGLSPDDISDEIGRSLDRLLSQDQRASPPAIQI